MKHKTEDRPPVVFTKREAESKIFSLFSCFFKLELLLNCYMHVMLMPFTGIFSGFTFLPRAVFLTIVIEACLLEAEGF